MNENRPIPMAISELWYLADRASHRAETAYHRPQDTYSPQFEHTHHRRVGRDRFETLAQRIASTGAPYGSQTIVYRPSGALLLVRHDGVDLWVLPGGEVAADESFVETARRELREEAGIDGVYDGLAMLIRIEVVHQQYSTWGVLPIFAAEARTHSLCVRDPDQEISDARWFESLPADTRDRTELVQWRSQAL